jgi:hypothetical protein
MHCLRVEEDNRAQELALKYFKSSMSRGTCVKGNVRGKEIRKNRLQEELPLGIGKKLGDQMSL